MPTNINWSTLGHEKIKDYFTHAIKNKNLAHAYLFYGPSGVGKKMLAKDIARELGAESGSGEKYKIIESEKRISVDQIRSLEAWLVLKTSKKGWRVAVIDNAENMTVEAQNAFLKTLEEPKSSTIFFLISSKPAKLLPTIVSRCQKVEFGEMDVEDIKNIVQKGDIDLSPSAFGLVSSGRGDFDARKKMFDIVIDFLDSGPAERAVKIRELKFEREEAIGFVEFVEKILRIKLMYVVGAIKKDVFLEIWGNNNNSDKMEGEAKLTMSIKLSTKIRRLLLQNVNVMLALENLALNI